MRLRTRVGILAVLFVAAFVATAVPVALASNQWSCWHWGKADIGVRSVASDGYWNSIIQSELGDWEAGTCLSFSNGSEITGDADFYGNTGWLGIARILDNNGCEILQADALMNRSYLDGSSYDETDDRHVACQELGHDVGLDHRKGPRNRTCMNDQFLGFPDFDQHDADTVASITTDAACSGGGGGSDPCANGGEKGRKKCSDGLDNDGDGCVDAADPDCK